ncbi:hydrolase NDAI_0H01560 [Naumovozyma dairenensis CBS 421]|uniref:Glycoside hydrolase family 5 C-terminal domain-containing protein n=1 Tax=Naumovozyma dairenensis (strain ATCC 10597 / BCRC 20456 / CBS 421 / NBRC 0211 / NRRL Y-12639) TaxID=1071378 RepID=G0WEW9_NAUDC|nr:hypothetical protein NDAI_0H01560 [Naumovozyma dairenensis CBS 421]CCD26330.1 hypothetical protein NDAI_0H01560 [Naumovozyma dairenensis CBS 421]
MPEKVLISPSGEFCDENGNVVLLRGVNLDPSVKYPASPLQSTHYPIVDSTFFEKALDVSFLNHPMPLEEVELHINKIKSLGYNTIRFPFTWESIEHEGPGQYDFQYMDYVIKFLKKINEIGGIYVYLDPHQDVWSRFCGGSGAPIWTLYCAGFQPARFRNTEAAILHNYFINNRDINQPNEQYPKMLWPTNYYRLACQTMFTLFFGGKMFAPRCLINGVNIQDYLQDCFGNAVMTFYTRIRSVAPELFENNCIIGLESLNEPNCGYIGTPDYLLLQKDRKLKLGTTPTAFQSFLLGEGIDTTVDTYTISMFGPSKSGSKVISCKGDNAWLNKEERDVMDKKFGWVRNQEWLPGRCIWRQHGVWDLSSEGALLIKPDYFSKNDVTNENIDDHYFINNHFVEYYENLHSRFREIDKEALLFLQPPVFKEPPKIKDTSLIDNRTVCACHFYDGLSLMFKTWNKYFNVNTFGIVRKKYSNPIFSLVLGEGNIRKCFESQLKEMKDEVKFLLGDGVPAFFTEIGMPFDMEDKAAYTSNDYSLQRAAMDSLGYALEKNHFSFSLWCYSTENSHMWGEGWNNEDFSIWSRDDLSSIGKNINRSQGKIITHEYIKIEPTSLVDRGLLESDSIDLDGFRATESLLRPFPIKIHGHFQSAEFQLENLTYTLRIFGRKTSDTSKSATYIFLPAYHFPLKSLLVTSSSGSFSYDPKYQVLTWVHNAGDGYIFIQAAKRRPATHNDTDSGCIMC